MEGGFPLEPSAAFLFRTAAGGSWRGLEKRGEGELTGFSGDFPVVAPGFCPANSGFSALDSGFDDFVTAAAGGLAAFSGDFGDAIPGSCAVPILRVLVGVAGDGGAGVAGIFAGGVDVRGRMMKEEGAEEG